MKSIRMIIMFLAIPFWASHSHAIEPASYDELTDPGKPGSPGFHAIEGKIYKVDAETRENCEGWVRLAYEKPSDILNGKVEVLDSKPVGKYDEEALQVLADSLSSRAPETGSRLVRVVEIGGQKKNVFTYPVNCDNVSVLNEKPDKMPDPDAK